MPSLSELESIFNAVHENEYYYLAELHRKGETMQDNEINCISPEVQA